MSYNFMSTETIDVEATAEAENKMAVATTNGGAVALARPLPLDEVHRRLEFVRQVMQQEMKEDQDYGKIPGTGGKPSLLQPGAQKLLLTFQLREQVKKEVLRDYPNYHREYEFTVTVFPAGGSLADGWDGVGTCSTLESKYRYRKATRVCPKCGAEAIIEEKPEYVRGREPGWVCWKKKNGCGEVFHKEHPDIASQSMEDVENEDPADCWNTVRKMAFKRALVAAAINATNTSELWTQDVEDMADNKGKQRTKDSQNAPGRSGGVSTSTPPGKAAPSPTAATPPQQKAGPSPKTITPQQAIFADDDTRKRMIGMFSDALPLLHEFFVKAGCILETEKLEDLPLKFVPVTKRQAKLLEGALAGFGNGEQAALPYPPNPEPDNAPPPRAKETVVKSGGLEAEKKRNPEWFFTVICPIPNRGQKRDDYLKQPDTILSLYRRMKEGDEAAQKRLWGFAKHWAPSERQVGIKVYPISQEDQNFREALNSFCEWEQKHGKDTQEGELLPDERPIDQ